MNKSKLNIGVKVSINTIVGNIILSIVKIVLGIISKSTAMTADGIHSVSDVISTVGVIIGLKLSNKEADKEHQYGHERIESLTALFLSIILFMVAIGIGYSGINNIINKSYNIPGKLAIVAAIISILTKEIMYQYTIKYSKLINSASLKADAWHHRSDSLSSIGALFGIAGARMGFPMLDSLVAILICLIIVKVSYDICKESIIQLIDQSASDEEVEKISNTILNIDGVIKIDCLRTRQYASKLYVDVDIAVNSKLTVEEGHLIASKVHDYVEKNKKIKHCMVHVNPYDIQ